MAEVSSDRPPSKLAPGVHLDRYELLTSLAQGGMATVWLARMKGKRGFERLVAVKTIRGEFSEDQRFQEMFLDEARIAAGIHHPNVAQIIDLGEHEDVLYLVMEYVDGESVSRLRRAAAKKGLKVPLPLALRMVADACAGLHAAHELKDDGGVNLQVVHRDVSPQNILVTTAGAVKVIDFGIAKARNRAAHETSVGLFKGKAPYMAPEQATGQVIDRRVDIWAMGVVLYELLTGKFPYDGDSQGEQLRLITSGAAPPPLPDDVPEDIHDIIRQSLAHTPAGRFSTAAAMQRAIETALGKIATTTSDDVASFVDQHLRERMAQKKALVQEAIVEAAAREGRNMTTAEMRAVSMVVKEPRIQQKTSDDFDDQAPTRKKNYEVPITLHTSAVEPGSVASVEVSSVETAQSQGAKRPRLLPLIIVLVLASLVLAFAMTRLVKPNKADSTGAEADSVTPSAKETGRTAEISASAAASPSMKVAPSVTAMPLPASASTAKTDKKRPSPAVPVPTIVRPRCKDPDGLDCP